MHLIACFVLLALGVSPNVRAQTGPAQVPLVNRGASVKPNVVFMVDNSSSMTFACLYLPHVVKSLALEFGSGKIPGQDVGCTTGLRHNSPANNALIYDPAKRYVPRYDDSGTAELANAPLSSTTTTIYLPKSAVDITQYTTKADLELASRYDRLDIKSTGFAWNGAAITTLNPLPKPAGRTDCLALPDTCSLPEERQNVANWLSFNSTRLLAAKNGIGHAFYPQADTFRLGWSTLVTSTSEVNTSGITTVQNFGSSRAPFYKWLNGIVANNPVGTYLRFTLDQAGRYYQRTDNAGPWAHTPWAPGREAATDHLSCRRAYSILMTDGLWNDPQAPTSVAGKDIDGTPGELITHSKLPGVRYQYKPHDLSDPRNVGKADNIVSGGNAGTLADLALHYWATDLRKDLANNATDGAPGQDPFWQSMTTYTISLGADGQMTPADIANAELGKQSWSVPAANSNTALDDLIHASHNGGGDYLSVRDSATFADKLGNVLAKIGADPNSEAGVAASAASLINGARKFVPYYTPNLWWGNLKMVELDASGNESGLDWQVVALDAKKRPTGVTTIPALADRKVWVWIDATKRAVAFNWVNVTTYRLKAATATANSGTLLVSTANQSLVDYLRGDRTNEGGIKTWRKREAIMGDIINSTPVFIKNIYNGLYERLPSTTPGLAQYSDYMKAKAYRAEGVIFVGANDGMVHGFREGANGIAGGTEVFAYVPRAVLGGVHKLADKNYQHQYYVDGPMAEADAYIQTPDATGTSSSTGWRNLVLGTTGAGAKAVFALNVTSALAMTGSSVLWEINDSMTGFEELGNVLTPVQTGIMQDGTWVGVFGNGYYSKSKKASLFIVNLATGALVKRIEPAVGVEIGANGLGGVRLVFNAKQQIIGAYAGDLKGRIWKFDMNSSSQAKWGVGLDGNALFTAKDSSGAVQPITAAPAVIERNDIAGYKPSYMVVAATGKLFDTTDSADIGLQAAYGLWDVKKFGDTGGTPIIGSALVELTVDSPASGYYQVSSPRPIDWSSDSGWVLPYKVAQGQRTIYSVEQMGSLVRVDTVVPPSSAAASCDSQYGLGYNFIINPLAGTCKASPTLDVNGDGKFDEKDGGICGYSTIADGADTVLTVPALSGPTSDIRSIQSATGQRLVSLDVPPPEKVTPNKAQSRSWRQIYLRAQ